jgi:hypothetical protein
MSASWFNPEATYSKLYFAAMEGAAPLLGVTMSALPVKSDAEIEPALASIARQTPGSPPTALIISARIDGGPGEPLRYFIAAAILALALVLAWGVVVAMRRDVPTLEAVAEPLREFDGGRSDKSSGGVSNGVRIIRTVPIFPSDITEVRQEPAGEVSAPPAPPLPAPRRVPATNICERYHGWQEFYDEGRRWRCVFPSKRT